MKKLSDDEIFATYNTFQNYTRDMYDGNVPAGKGHEMIDGGFADRWDFKYGNAKTYNGKILHASFNISSKVHILYTMIVCGLQIFAINAKLIFGNIVLIIVECLDRHALVKHLDIN